MIHTVQSPQLHVFRPEDGRVKRTKHVIGLNKDNIR